MNNQHKQQRINKRKLGFWLVLLFLSFFLFATFAHAVVIEIQGGQANPEELIIEQHERVVWKNLDAGTFHELNIPDLALTSLLGPDREFGYVFSEAGEYPYVVKFDPQATGKVTVQATEEEEEEQEELDEQNQSMNVTTSDEALEAFLQAVAEAEEPGASFTFFPNINIPFDEMVPELNATFYLVDTNTPPLEEIETPLEPENFILEVRGNPKPRNPARSNWDIKPVQSVPPGLYLVQIKAYDRVNNELLLNKPITVNYTPLDIEIRHPRLGIVTEPSRSFDLIVGIKKDGRPVRAQCKFGFIDPTYRFYAGGLNPSANLVGETHMFPAFGSIERFDFSEGHRGNKFFVICMTEQGEINQQEFEIYRDTQRPVINEIVFDPPEIIEYPLDGGPLRSVMTVEANEEVQCKLSFNGPRPFATEMTPFDNFDMNNFENYQNPNTYVFEDIQRPPKKKATFPYAIQCVDRAGFLSEPRMANLHIDLTRPIALHFIKPDTFSTDPHIELNFTTNRRAYCHYVYNNVTTEITNENNPGLDHYADAGVVNEGVHDFDLTCTNNEGEEPLITTLTRRVTIDTSPPQPPTVEGSVVTCNKDRFEFNPPLTLTAEDDISGIARYHAAIPELEINETVDDEIEELEFDDEVLEELEEGTSYNLLISAIDGAGSESQAVTASVRYDPMHDLCREHDPPTVRLETRSIEGGVQVVFLCTDESGCDENNFYYGTMDIGGTSDTTPEEDDTTTSDEPEVCTANQKLEQPFMIEVRRTQKICWEAVDMLGNKAEGSRVIPVRFTDTCLDGIQNGNEAGIDCGGDCGATCDEGVSGCSSDIDCLTDYCEAGTCQEPTCNDGVRNQGESDIDCGGPCGKCDTNNSCQRDFDCISGYCDTQQMCQIASCEDSIKNGEEGDIDCGASCPNKCEKGKKCTTNDDCGTNKCNFGVCEEPIGIREPTVIEGEEPTPEDEVVAPTGITAFLKGPVFMILLGILFIGGGVGYLVTQQPSAKRASPRLTPTLPPKPFFGLTRTKKPDTAKKEREKRQKAAQERAKKAAEARKKLREERRAKRSAKRNKLLSVFGKGKPGAKKEPGFAPIFTAKKKPRVKILPKVHLKEDWVPLDRLHKAFKAVLPKKVKKQFTPPPKVKKTSPEFSKLDVIAKTKQQKRIDDMTFHKQQKDVFAEMEDRVKQRVRRKRKR